MKKLFTTWLLLALAVLGFQAKAELWLIGDLSPDGWDASKGVQFTSTGDNSYTLDINLTAGNNKYFSLTTKLGSNKDDWNSILDYRFGGAGITVTVGQDQVLVAGTSDSPKVSIPTTGTYTITFNTSSRVVNISAKQTETFDATKRKFAVTGAAVGGWNMPPADSQIFTNNGDGTYTWTGTVTSGEFKFSGVAENDVFDSGWSVFNSGAMGKSPLAEGDNAMSTSFGSGNLTMPVGGDVTLTVSNVTATSCNLNISVNQVIVLDPAFTIHGNFDGSNWTDVSMEPAQDGSFSVTIENIQNGTEFKLFDENEIWYGGSSDNKVITRDNCSEIPLVDGDNFQLPEGGTLTFTVDSDKELTVSGWSTMEYTTLYVLGDFQSWKPNNGLAMTYDTTNKIFTGTVTLNDEGYIKFTTQLSESEEWTIDEYLWGADSDGDFVVTESQLGTNLSLKSKGASFKLPAGEWDLTVDLINGTLVIEGDWPVIPITDLYIAGSFTDWANGKLQMTADNNGGFSLKVDNVPDGAEFKFIDQDNKWYGATPKSGDNYVVSIDDCTGIHILRDAGSNLKVSGAGNLTFTVDAHNNLTVSGWPGEGIPLAEALAGEAGEVVIKSDMAVVVSNSDYAIVSDGLGNWLKVTGLNLPVGDVIYRVAGTISGLNLNPVMAVTSYLESAKSVTVTPKSVVLVTATEEEITALKANEVAVITGYYNASEGKLFANRPGLPQGKCIAVTTSHMVGTLNDGVAVSVTGVLSLKEAWETPADAPARAQKNNQGYLNYTLDASQSSPATGVDDVKVIDGKQVVGIYNVNGQQVKSTDHGVYIIRYSDGTAAKVRL